MPSGMPGIRCAGLFVDECIVHPERLKNSPVEHLSKSHSFDPLDDQCEQCITRIAVTEPRPGREVRRVHSTNHLVHIIQDACSLKFMLLSKQTEKVRDAGGVMHQLCDPDSTK